MRLALRFSPAQGCRARPTGGDSVAVPSRLAMTLNLVVRAADVALRTVTPPKAMAGTASCAEQTRGSRGWEQTQ